MVAGELTISFFTVFRDRRNRLIAMVACASLVLFVALPLLVFGGDDKAKGPKVTDKVSVIFLHPLILHVSLTSALFYDCLTFYG